MRNALTYNAYVNPADCLLFEGNGISRNYADLLLPLMFGLVDSRVPAKCEVVYKQFHELLINRYRYPGFNHNKPDKESLIMHAKMLGKTYKPQLSFQTKGSIIAKQLNGMKTLQVKKILVPTDFSETGMLALEHATFMAGVFKAQLYLLHVVETFEYTDNVYVPAGVIKDTEEVHEVVAEKLEKLAKQITLEKAIQVKALVGTAEGLHQE